MKKEQSKYIPIFIVQTKGYESIEFAAVSYELAVKILKHDHQILNKQFKTKTDHSPSKTHR